jgi:hypothetical protein
MYNNNEQTKVNWIKVSSFNGITLEQSDNSGVMKLTSDTDNGRYGLRPETLLQLLDTDIDLVKNALRELVIARQDIQARKKVNNQVAQMQAKLEADRAKSRQVAIKALQELGFTPEQIATKLADLLKVG